MLQSNSARQHSRRFSRMILSSSSLRSNRFRSASGGTIVSPMLVSTSCFCSTSLSSCCHSSQIASQISHRVQHDGTQRLPTTSCNWPRLSRNVPPCSVNVTVSGTVTVKSSSSLVISSAGSRLTLTPCIGQQEVMLAELYSMQYVLSAGDDEQSSEKAIGVSSTNPLTATEVLVAFTRNWAGGQSMQNTMWLRAGSLFVNS